MDYTELRSLWRGNSFLRFRRGHWDGRCPCGTQQARHQRGLTLGLLVAIADIRIVNGWLIDDLEADGIVLRQFLLVVADAP